MPEYQLYVWNGEQTTSYSAGLVEPKLSYYLREVIPDVPSGGGAMVTASDLRGLMDLFRRDFGYSVFGEKNVSETVLKLASRPGSKVEIREGVDGSDVICIAQGKARSTDIDPSSGMLLSNVRESADMGFRIERKVGAVFHSHGVSFPDDISVFVDPGKSENNRVIYESTYKAVPATCRKLSPTEFEDMMLPHLPPGTKVNDRIEGRIYEIAPKSE